MKKDKRSRFLTVIFASAMLCVSPVDADEHSVDNIDDVNNYLMMDNSTVKITKDLYFYKDDNVFHPGRGSTIMSADGYIFTLSGFYDEFNPGYIHFFVNANFNIENIKLSLMQIINDGPNNENEAINLMGSNFDGCSSSYIYVEDNRGGVIYNKRGLIVSKDIPNTFSNNELSENNSMGGVMYNSSEGTIQILVSDTFEKNSAAMGQGGAIYNEGKLLISPYQNTGNVEFINNNATEAGAIYNSSTGTLDISSATFLENHSLVKGSAISSYGEANIKNSIFEEQYFTGRNALGGAIFNGGTGTLNVENCNFERNKTNPFVDGDNIGGGAIYNEGNAKLTANDKAFNFIENQSLISGSSDVEKAGFGGAIYNESKSTLILEATGNDGIFAFRRNSAKNGGAIANKEETTVSLTKSNFKYNISKNDGGAIWNKGKATISDSLFTANKSEDGNGGTIYNAEGGTVEITDTSFISNRADAGDGGAIANYGTLNISDSSSFTGNKTTDSDGGAIYNAEGGTVEITDTSFISNSADAGDGGAIYNAESGTVEITDTSFTSNRADAGDGGAIYNQENLTITAKDEKVKFSTNTASRGGAIFNTNNTRSAANLYIVAEENDISFDGNNVSSNHNAIYNESDGSYNANIFLNAKDSHVITLSDTIDGSANVDNQIININQSYSTKAPTNGTINFKNIISNNTVNIFNGTVNIVDSAFIDSTAKINLNGGTLNIESGDITYNGINIGSGTIFNHDLIGGGDSQTLNGNNIQFTGSGATAKFSSNDGTTRDINLSAISSATGANTVHIDGANVDLAETSYLGDTIYKFTNSKIDISGKTYEFDNIKTDGKTKLSFNVKINRDDIKGNYITTDTLKANNETVGVQYFDIDTIHISGEENGQRGAYKSKTNLLEGKAKLNDPISTATFDGATTSWIYKVTRDGDQNISLEIVDYADSNTLNDMNIKEGKRFFQFSDDDDREYHVANALYDTAAGEFTVKGNNRNIISGNPDGYPLGDKVDLFKLVNKTKLTIDNVTIKDSSSVAKLTNADAELNIRNSIIESNSSGSSGAITVEKGKATILESEFNGNGHSTLEEGSAIKNDKDGTVKISNSQFNDNYSQNSGAIHNDGNLEISDGTTFEKNSATSAVGCGGAIYNDANGTATISSSTFKENQSYNLDGGAIYNKSDLTVANSFFNDNTAINSDGGAIYSDTNKTVTIAGSEFNGNKASKYGGAIYNRGTLLDVSNTEFTNNSVNGKSGQGGAIYSKIGNLKITDSVFSGNHSEQAGGAVALESGANISNSSFESNNTKGEGGAISIQAKDQDITVNIVDTSFTNNQSTESNGGAIYNADSSGNKTVINILAENEDVLFNGNTDSTGSNAIYNNATGEGVEINLNVNNDKDIIFFDGIDGNSANVDKQVININKPNGSVLSTNGYVEFDNVVKNNTVNLYDGVLAFGENNGTFGTFDSSVVFNVNGGSVDLANDTIQNVNFGNLTLNSDMNLFIDGNFATKELDTFTADSFTSNGNIINIKEINLIAPTETKQFSISPLGTFADDAVKDAVAQAIQYTGGDIVYSPIYQYKVTYDPTTAMLRFGMGGQNENFNPAVLAAPVGTQIGAYLNQVNVYEQAFSNMDMMMIMPKAQRNAMKYANKYASAQGAGNGGVITFSPNQIPEENRGLWFRPYTTFENVGLSKGPNVKNIAYGSLVGGDTGIIELKRGWDMVASVYGAYNGSNQNYDGVTMTQNGGSLGVSGVWYKGNFFSGLTANVGANSGEANSMYGKDTFTTLATGVASKTGYNFELANGKFIIQPNYLMSYTFVNTFDYTNAAGVKISSDPLNAIQIAPGVKLIGNLKNGWQPYLGVQMVWNIMDRTRFKANNVELPNMSVDPYIQYGVGLQKKVGDRFTGFGQAMMRNGGRNGIALQFGFRWSL